MPRPTTKDELLAASESRYRALLALVDGLPPEALDREFAVEDRDRRVRDVLGHLRVWHLMMLDLARCPSGLVDVEPRRLGGQEDPTAPAHARLSVAARPGSPADPAAGFTRTGTPGHGR